MQTHPKQLVRTSEDDVGVEGGRRGGGGEGGEKGFGDFVFYCCRGVVLSWSDCVGVLVELSNTKKKIFLLCFTSTLVLLLLNLVESG